MVNENAKFLLMMHGQRRLMFAAMAAENYPNMWATLNSLADAAWGNAEDDPFQDRDHLVDAFFTVASAFAAEIEFDVEEEARDYDVEYEYLRRAGEVITPGWHENVKNLSDMLVVQSQQAQQLADEVEDLKERLAREKQSRDHYEELYHQYREYNARNLENLHRANDVSDEWAEMYKQARGQLDALLG